MTRATRNKDLNLATAFVRKNTPTFAQIIAQIEVVDTLCPSRQRDLISGLKRVATAIEWRVEDCPADPVWLRPRIAAVRPAALSIMKKTWTTTISNARSALAAVGILERDRGSPLELTQHWKTLWDAALATRAKNITIPASRFVRFCSNMGIAPQEVTDITMADFRRALELSEIRKDPESATWHAIHAWNLAVDRVPGWPQIRLTKPVRHTHYALPIDTFAPSFVTELNALAKALALPNLVRGTNRRSPLRPRTIEHRIQQIRRFASALVRSGTPPHELRTLHDLLHIERVRAGLEWLARERHKGKTSPGLHETALGICMLGRELGVDDADLEELRDMARVLSGRLGTRFARPKGLTAKNRERLRQFRNPLRRDALLTLPEALMETARLAKYPVKAARLAEVALAIAIETVAPIRLNNLAALELERHLDRSVSGKLYLAIPESEVKNGTLLEFELSPRISNLIDRFCTEHRQHLIARPCPWLFARVDGAGPVHPNVLARRITETIGERIGIEMNVHMFRHIAAMLILEENPGAYDLVRRLLGHSELSTTIDAYGGMESISATRMLADIVEQAQANSPPQVFKRKRK